MHISVAEAESKLPELLKAVEGGERVTICRCFRDELATDDGAAAGSVLDDERLREGFIELWRKKPSDGVGAASRGEGDDKADRFHGICAGNRRLRRALGAHMSSATRCCQCNCG